MDTNICYSHRPKEIFKDAPPTLYTVASTAALKNIQNGVLLLPATEHHSSIPKIHTHKGIGLVLFSVLMQEFGFDLQLKDDFVWLGSQVDAEQLVLEERISQSGRQVDIELIRLLFDVDDPEDYLDRLQTPSMELPNLHPQFVQVVDALSREEVLYHTDAAARDYVDDFLQTLHHYTGVREGWFLMLEGVLKGDLAPTMRPDAHYFTQALFNALERKVQQVKEPTRMIVFAVNKDRIIHEFPIYPFPMSARPPHTIVPAPLIPLSVVTAAYVPDNLEIDALSIPTLPFDQLPKEAWLTDNQNIPVTPSDVTEVDPRKPLCSLRYGLDPYSFWISQFLAGNFAPFSTKSEDVVNPQTPFGQFLRRLLIHHAEATGLRTILRENGYPVPSKSYYASQRSVMMPSIQQYLMHRD